MKRQQTPQEKKALSYAFERRDTYGENNKSSRKNVARRKTSTNRKYRHTVRQKLMLTDVELTEELGNTIDFAARTVSREQFRKWSGTPLREVVIAKLKRRAELERKVSGWRQGRI